MKNLGCCWKLRLLSRFYYYFLLFLLIFLRRLRQFQLTRLLNQNRFLNLLSKTSLKILCFLLHNLSQLLKTNSLISFKVYIQTCTWHFGNIMKSLKLLTWSINWPLCRNVICCDVHIVHVSMIPFINRGFFFWRVAILLIRFSNFLSFFWLYY